MRSFLYGLLPTAIFFLHPAQPTRADSVDPLRLLPDSTLAVVTIDSPRTVLDGLLAPEYYEPLVALKAVDKALHAPALTRLKQLVGLLEARLDTSWQDALRTITGGGITLAFDAKRQAAILIVRSEDSALLKKLNDTLSDLIEVHARSQGNRSPSDAKEYRGVRTWSFGPGEQHAIVGDMLVISNQGEALRAVLDLHADRSAAGLAGKAAFTQARRQAGTGNLAWAMVDIEALRQLPKVAAALAKKSDNPGQEMLFGGVADALRTARYATASLRLDGKKLRLQAELPRNSSEIASNRRWWFASSGSDGDAAVLEPKNALANLTIDHDFAGMWAAREELFSERVNAGLTQADTGLGLFFSGRDFGPEVLAKLAPRWQFVAVRREFPASQPIPAIKLPAMALVIETKDDAFADELFLAFQNAVGIINLQGIQTGRPQLLLDGKEYHGAKIRLAHYLPPRETPKDNARLEYNFNPTAARIGSRFVIGTTYELACELVDLLQKPVAARSSDQNTSLEIDGGQLRAAFEDNRDLLVSRAMLSSGDDKKAAQKQVDSLLDLGRLIHSASVQLLAQPQRLVLDVSIALGK